MGDIVEEGDSDPDPIIERDPCLDKPVALEPLTDETGSIISIPLDSQGCPYLEPPRVCLLYTSPSPRDVEESRMPSSA